MSGTSTPTRKFDAWVVKAANTVYLAITDGIAISSGVATVTLYGYTDGSNPPTTMIESQAEGASSGSLVLPVRKGDYWQIISADGTELTFWLPES